MVRISVQDNGIGIDPQNLPYIFDRFYRSDESRARETGGSGLGLAIMKWIIDRHGGTIEVVSRKDIGTRTTILLPKAA
jgi:signal transduction histidine kinase